MEASDDGGTTAGFKVELTNALEAVPLNNTKSSNNPNHLEDAIRKWMSDEPDTPLLYVLQDSSNANDISINGLAPTDLTRFCCLQSLESRHHFYVFISQVEKREIGTETDIGRSPKDKDPNVDIIEWAVQLALDAHGSRILPTLDIKPESILRRDILSDCEPDEEDGLPGDYDEPEHPDLRGFCRRYRSLALLMIPQVRMTTYVLGILLQSSDIVPIADLLESFSSRCSIPASDDMHFETLINLCEYFFSQRKTKMHFHALPESTVAKIIEVAVLFKDHPLFELVCNNIDVILPPYFFSQIAVKLHGSEFSLTTLGSAFDRSVLGQPTLGDRTSEETPKELREFVLRILDKMVELCYASPLYEQDGETLVLIACHHRDYGWLLDKLSPLVSERCDSIAFVVGFGWQLYASAFQGKLEVSDSFEFLKDTLKTLIARFDVTRLISEQGFQRWQQQRAPRGYRMPLNTDTAPPPPPPPPPVTSDTLLHMCRLLLDLGMGSDLCDLARKLIEQSERIDLLEFADLYIPFAGGFMDLLRSRSISITDPLFSALTRTIIQSFWTRYIVMGEPVPTLNERRQTYNQKLVKSSWVKRVEHARHQLAKLNQGNLLLVLGRDYYNVTGNVPPYSGHQEPDVIIIDPPSKAPTQSSTENTTTFQGAPSYIVSQPLVADHFNQRENFQIYRSQEPQLISTPGIYNPPISSSTTPLEAQCTPTQAGQLPAAVHPQDPSVRAALAIVSPNATRVDCDKREGQPSLTGSKRKQLDGSEFADEHPSKK
ncbi:hypothetical protein Daesc_010077 [Daldinia eschscholtzii]|uniref:Uncharacterized protein n=1 Tax=Daldinia eschscholtzii TaxID=292717 RepID=A0AAX6M7Y1_9PEZI